MTAATNLIFSSLLVGTNGQDALPAAVLGAATAWLTMKVLQIRWAQDPMQNLLQLRKSMTSDDHSQCE